MKDVSGRPLQLYPVPHWALPLKEYAMTNQRSSPRAYPSHECGNRLRGEHDRFLPDRCSWANSWPPLYRKHSKSNRPRSNPDWRWRSRASQAAEDTHWWKIQHSPNSVWHHEPSDVVHDRQYRREAFWKNLPQRGHVPQSLALAQYEAWLNWEQPGSAIRALRWFGRLETRQIHRSLFLLWRWRQQSCLHQNPWRCHHAWSSAITSSQTSEVLQKTNIAPNNWAIARLTLKKYGDFSAYLLSTF